MTLTIPEIQRMAGVSDQMVHRWIKRDGLRTMRRPRGRGVGTGWLIDPADLESWAWRTMAITPAVRVAILKGLEAKFKSEAIS